MVRESNLKISDLNSPDAFQMLPGVLFNMTIISHSFSDWQGENGFKFFAPLNINDLANSLYFLPQQAVGMRLLLCAFMCNIWPGFVPETQGVKKRRSGQSNNDANPQTGGAHTDLKTQVPGGHKAQNPKGKQVAEHDEVHVFDAPQSTS